MKRFCLFSSLALMMFMISACGTIPVIPPNPANPVKSVAVLPLVNNTTDVDAPQMVREKLVEAVKKRHYSVMPIEEVDRRLRDQLGISLGGQLAAATSDQLCSVLEVDGLLYGTLMDFQESTIGLYNVKKVRARFQMINALNNSTMWENGLGVKSEVTMAGSAGLAAGLAANIADSKTDDGVPWVTIDTQSSREDFGTTLGMNLALKLLSKATGSHLARETNEMIKRVLDNFPAGPGVAISFDLPDMPTLPPINIGMMTPPMGHMDFGDRDFSAVMVTTWNDTRQKEPLYWKTPLAKRAQRVRMEIDYSRMVPDGDTPPPLGKIIMLYQGDKQKTYSLYPEREKYIEYQESNRQVFEKPEMTLSKEGTEIIDGHPTQKYLMEMRLADGTTATGYIWNATDLGDMTIKTYLKYEQADTTMLLTDIQMKTPPSSLFEVPPGYSKSESMLDMIITQE